MNKEELDIQTLSPEELRPTEAQRLSLEPNESITLRIKAVRAFRTDFGILWVYVGDSETDVYSFSSWNVIIKPRLVNMPDLVGKLVKVSNTGFKRYMCEY